MSRHVWTLLKFVKKLYYLNLAKIIFHCLDMSGHYANKKL